MDYCPLAVDPEMYEVLVDNDRQLETVVDLRIVDSEDGVCSGESFERHANCLSESETVATG